MGSDKGEVLALTRLRASHGALGRKVFEMPQHNLAAGASFGLVRGVDNLVGRYVSLPHWLIWEIPAKKDQSYVILIFLALGQLSNRSHQSLFYFVKGRRPIPDSQLDLCVIDSGKQPAVYW